MNADFKLILMVSLVLVAGCAHLNEGCIDYRKADGATGTAGTIGAAGAATAGVVTSGTTAPGAATAGAVMAGTGRTNLTLLKKYEKSSDSDRRLFRNDTISLHLQQAFIKDFHETNYNPFKKEENIQGEIAIVIKVFELSDGKDFDFNAKAAEDGRVVFYSPDVRKGQFLNFSAMPIYGPITYNGNPLALDIFVIELDSTDERTKNLLQTLATAGSASYPPASPILGILDTMGSSLLKGNKNDVEFRYSMVLYPDKGYKNLNQSVLEAGNYVFIKQDDKRGEQLKWSEFTLDQKSGRLYTAATNQMTPDEFKEKTYLVVQINKGYDASNLDLSQNTFGKLLRNINEENVEIGQAYKAAFDKFLDTQKQTKKFSDLRQMINDIETTPVDQSNRRKSLSTDFIARLFEEINNETDPAKKDKKDKLNAEQIDYLLDNLKKLVNSDPALYAGIDREKLKTLSFQTKVIDLISK